MEMRRNPQVYERKKEREKEKSEDIENLHILGVRQVGNVEGKK